MKRAQVHRFSFQAMHMQSWFFDENIGSLLFAEVSKLLVWLVDFVVSGSLSCALMWEIRLEYPEIAFCSRVVAQAHMQASSVPSCILKNRITIASRFCVALAMNRTIYSLSYKQN